MDETVRAGALARIPKAEGEFLRCARRAIGRNHPEELHEARIAAKRLRYAIEYFAPTLGSSHATALGLLAHLQDRLGSIADETAFVALCDRVRETLQADDPRVEGIAALRAAAILRRENAVVTLRRLWLGGEFPPYPDMLAASIAAALDRG